MNVAVRCPPNFGMKSRRNSFESRYHRICRCYVVVNAESVNAIVRVEYSLRCVCKLWVVWLIASGADGGAEPRTTHVPLYDARPQFAKCIC